MQTDIVLSDRELDELFAPNSNLRIHLKAIEAAAPSSPTRSSAPSSPANSPKGEMIPLPEGVVPQRCGYRTGKCTNLQAVKRNGKLHKLCEFHREKANQNQKKLDRKKRLMRYSPYDSHMSDDESCASSVANLEESPRAIDDHHHRQHHIHQPHYDVFAPHPTSLHEAPLALGGEELAIFCNLMTFDASQRSVYAYSRPAALYHRHHAPQYSVV